LTEIPEHLLKRSKAAKGGKSGATPTDEAGSAPVAASAAAPVAAASAVPTAALPNLDPEPVPAKPEPAYVTASKARKRIPAWALPMVAALPIWAIAFAGTMQQPEGEDILFVESEFFYTSAGCSGCHGGAGEGVSGYALNDGSVVETFPSAIDQMVHVARGSAEIGGEAYGAERADGRRVSGDLRVMPPQLTQLSQVELELVVFHERATLSGEDTSDPGYQEWMEHMREAFESGDEEPIDLDLLLACANPDYTPGATGEGSEDCPGPVVEGEEAALGS